jgi:predicted transcriptional regulator
MHMDTKEPTVTTSIRLPASVMRVLRAEADEKNRPVSYIITKAIEGWIESAAVHPDIQAAQAAPARGEVAPPQVVATDSNPHQVLTRAEAKAAGATRYFTGIPCQNGHVDERYTKSGACLSCLPDIRGRYRASGSRGRYKAKPGPARAGA